MVEMFFPKFDRNLVVPLTFFTYICIIRSVQSDSSEYWQIEQSWRTRGKAQSDSRWEDGRAFSLPECSISGYFPHPGNCKKYYQCHQWSENSIEFFQYEFDCPPGTAFDESLDICNHPEAITPALSAECLQLFTMEPLPEPIENQSNNIQPAEESTDNSEQLQISNSLVSQELSSGLTQQSQSQSSNSVSHISTSQSQQQSSQSTFSSQSSQSSTSHQPSHQSQMQSHHGQAQSHHGQTQSHQGQTQSHHGQTQSHHGQTQSHHSTSVETASGSAESDELLQLSVGSQHQEQAMITDAETVDGSTTENSIELDGNTETVLMCSTTGLKPYPGSCKKFYRCDPIPGNENVFSGVVFDCPPGTIFDDKQEVCNHPDMIDQPVSTDCLALLSADLTKPTISGVFDNQSQGHIDISTSIQGGTADQSGESGTMSSSDSQNALSEVSGINSSEYEDTSIGSSSHSNQLGSVQTTSGQASFNSTSSTGSSTSQGQSQTTMTQSHQSTSSESETGSSQINTIEQIDDGENLECLIDGYYPHPGNCRKFYRCHEWSENTTTFSRYVFDCPPGTAFDEKMGICNHPGLVDPPLPSECLELFSLNGLLETSENDSEMNQLSQENNNQQVSSTEIGMGDHMETSTQNFSGSVASQSTEPSPNSVLSTEQQMNTQNLSQTTILANNEHSSQESTNSNVSNEENSHHASTSQTQTDINGETSTIAVVNESSTLNQDSSAALDNDTVSVEDSGDEQMETHDAASTASQSSSQESSSNSQDSTLSTTSSQNSSTVSQVSSSISSDGSSSLESSSSLENSSSASGSSSLESSSSEEFSSVSQGDAVSSQDGASVSVETSSSTQDNASSSIVSSSPSQNSQSSSQSSIPSIQDETSSSADISSSSQGSSSSITDIVSSIQNITSSFESSSNSPDITSTSESSTIDSQDSSSVSIDSTSNVQGMSHVSTSIAQIGSASAENASAVSQTSSAASQSHSVSSQQQNSSASGSSSIQSTMTSTTEFDSDSAGVHTGLTSAGNSSGSDSEFTLICGRSGYVRHPQLCNQFYQCNWNGKHWSFVIGSCSVNESFSEELQRCQARSENCAVGSEGFSTMLLPSVVENANYTWSSEIQSQSSSQIFLSSSFQCQSPGFFPYEADCVHFYRCVYLDSGELTKLLYKCPGSYEYRSEMRRCLPPVRQIEQCRQSSTLRNGEADRLQVRTLSDFDLRWFFSTEERKSRASCHQ